MPQATGSKQSKGHTSTINSCIGMTRVAGELVAIPHPVPKSGFKAAPPGQRPGSAFNGTTTNNEFIRLVRAAADSTDVHHKRLMPYRCWAPRNRPREMMTNVAGKRYGVHPTTRTERYKGQSQVSLSDADPESRKPWRTTNQVFQACAQEQGAVGLANAGIASDVASRLHKTQGIYTR